MTLSQTSPEHTDSSNSLTDPGRDDPQEQENDGDVGLRSAAGRDVVKQHCVVGPVDGRAVREQRLVAPALDPVGVLLALPRHHHPPGPESCRGAVGLRERHQQAEVHGAPGSEDGADAQQEAAQVQAAGDDPRVDQAVGFPQLGEHDRSHQARDGRHAHEQAEEGAADALRVGIARGDAVEAQHRGVEEGQAHACQEDGLAVIRPPAVLAGAQEPLEPLKAQGEVGDLLQVQADVAVLLGEHRGCP